MNMKITEAETRLNEARRNLEQYKLRVKTLEKELRYKEILFRWVADNSWLAGIFYTSSEKNNLSSDIRQLKRYLRIDAVVARVGGEENIRYWEQKVEEAKNNVLGGHIERVEEAENDVRPLPLEMLWPDPRQSGR